MSSSNVGNAQVYEAGDQRNPPDSEKKENQAERFHEGKENSHNEQDPSKSTMSISLFSGTDSFALQRMNAPSPIDWPTPDLKTMMNQAKLLRRTS